MNTSKVQKSIHKNYCLENLPNEIWKDVPLFIGFYKVSNLGRVKSLKRWSNAGVSGYIKKERILKQSLNIYLNVCLSKNNKRKNFLVHQLVSMAFLNHKSKGHLIVVDHIDNNKLNNNLNNLKLISHRENISKGMNQGTSKYTGVYFQKTSRKWICQIRVDGKKKHLGLFKCEKEAGLAYQKALYAI